VAAEIEAVVPIAGGSARDELIGRAKRGDREAFALLIEPRALRLLRTARAILNSDSDAHEAVQETLIAAWIGLPRLRDELRFEAWLARILVNQCRESIRRRGRVREIHVEGLERATPDIAEASVTQAAILHAFDRLSVEERHILVLRHLHDLPVAAIAAQLDIPVGTAKSRLWTARRSLERALETES